MFRQASKLYAGIRVAGAGLEASGSMCEASGSVAGWLALGTYGKLLTRWLAGWIHGPGCSLFKTIRKQRSVCNFIGKTST